MTSRQKGPRQSRHWSRPGRRDLRPPTPATGTNTTEPGTTTPKEGRFPSEDPIGFWGGVDYHAYVHGSPVIFTDPSGLFDLGTGTAVVVTVGGGGGGLLLGGAIVGGAAGTVVVINIVTGGVPLGAEPSPQPALPPPPPNPASPTETTTAQPQSPGPSASPPPIPSTTEHEPKEARDCPAIRKECAEQANGRPGIGPSAPGRSP
jgi:hypothetical protein